MKFSDFVKTEAIKAELTAADKEGVVRELVTSLVESGQLGADDLDGIVQAILKREELGSTGIGRGRVGKYGNWSWYRGPPYEASFSEKTSWNRWSQPDWC